MVGRGQAGGWLGCHVPEPWKLGEYMRSSACSRGLSVVDFVVASVVLRHRYSKHLFCCCRCCCRTIPPNFGKQHSHLLRFPHPSADLSKTELANLKLFIKNARSPMVTNRHRRHKDRSLKTKMIFCS